MNNNQFPGCEEKRTLFGVLGTDIRETQISVKPKVCWERESGAYEDKGHQVVKVV